MQQLNERQQQLLNMLAWKKDFMSLEELARKTHCSKRTMYDDLKQLGKWLNSQDFFVALERKRRKGVKLLGEVNRIRGLSNLDYQESEMLELLPETRQMEISQMLLLDEEVITYQRLMDKYFISSTSIKKDLEKIQRNFQIHLLSTKHGTYVKDSEENIRRSLFLLCLAQLKNDDFEEQGETIFYTFFGEKMSKFVFQKVFEISSAGELTLPSQYVKSLAIHLLIFLHRLEKGYSLEIEKDFLFEQIKSIEIYYLANKLLEDGSDVLGFSFSKEDVEGLVKLIVSQGVRTKATIDERDRRIENIVEQLMENMSEILQIDFLKDKTLKKHLLLHFMPMLYRLNTGIRLKNPLLEEIKEQYMLTFDAVRYALDDIESRLQLTLNDDEISFLTVYFQVSMEKKDFGKKILIVCPTGIGTSELVINKIRKMLPQKDIVETTTVRQLEMNDLSQIDFIISSVKLEAIDKPIVQVSPLITQEDLRNISTLYSENFFSNHENERTNDIDFKKLEEIFDTNAIYVKNNLKEKNECLNFLIDQLEKSQKVNSAFRQDVFERESFGNTSLATGVALPHATPKNVHISQISLLILDKEIQWSEYKVQAVILIGIAEKDRGKIKEILSEIYKVISTKERVKTFLTEMKKRKTLKQ
ncbi:Transcriptional antiterminator [Pilibacter termitis]|uniref:Transcriptional antiterminator n=1 Tax=Pilibacter termitis TaxID=263852 RepID=A0A1T4K0R8_9ENTE|nr:BglG family transcription antiterminator [Pilibacter termitis]SJZ36013.1 Transcriptional antiterminator [Pilibacter termitis]